MGIGQESVPDASPGVVDPDLQAVSMVSNGNGDGNGNGRRHGWDDVPLAEMMRDFGFATCRRYDPLRRRMEKGAAGSGNTLFVRDVAAMQEGVAGARRFLLVNGEI